MLRVDTRERKWAHIEAYFHQHGIEYTIKKCDVGDYMLTDNPKLTIDRKMSLIELCGNICQQHARFKREMERAVATETRLIFLVEHGGKITSLDSVTGWANPRLKTSPYAMSGEALHKRMITLSMRYGVEWRFCSKSQTGKIICEILGVNPTNGEASQ